MVQTTKNTRKEQAENTRKKLFNAALNVMKEKGYEQTTIREICKRANTSLGSFYTYFKSKDAVLQSYYDDAVQTYATRFQANTEALTPKEKLLEFYDWYADYTTSIGVDFCRIFFSPSNKALDIDKVYNQIMITTLEFVDQGFDEHIFNRNLIKPKALNKDICIVFKGAVLDWCAEDAAYDLKSYAHHLIATYLRAVSLN